jgi:hypothetical protein
MEYSCSICLYTSVRKADAIKHINKKRPCGEGNRELITTHGTIECKYCKIKFVAVDNMLRHQRLYCKKEAIKDAKIKELQERNKELEEKLYNKPTTINNTINITINNYENTSLEKLTDSAINKLIIDNEPYQIIPKFIKELHFNKDIPENHNIYISNRNKNNNHLLLYRDGHWEAENKKTEIENVIYDKETNISDWIDQNGDEYPGTSEKYNEYLEQKYDEETARLIISEVELMLYNNRHLIKNRI